MSSQSQAKYDLVGDVPRLPLRVAGRVAWSSIKVRMSRSLVTVSSVVLAVAFLLVVLGGDLSDRAVYHSYAEDLQAQRDIEFIQETTTRTREPLVLMRLLAEDEDISEWSARYGEALPAYRRKDAVDLMILADWVDDLKATDRFQVLENRSLTDWILALDDEGRVVAFLDKAGTFPTSASANSPSRCRRSVVRWPSSPPANATGSNSRARAARRKRRSTACARPN